MFKNKKFYSWTLSSGQFCRTQIRFWRPWANCSPTPLMTHTPSVRWHNSKIVLQLKLHTSVSPFILIIASKSFEQRLWKRQKENCTASLWSIRGRNHLLGFLQPESWEAWQNFPMPEISVFVFLPIPVSVSVSILFPFVIGLVSLMFKRAGIHYVIGNLTKPYTRLSQSRAVGQGQA